MYLYIYIYIWHHLIYINNIYIYFICLFNMDHFIKDFWKHHTSRKPPFFFFWRFEAWTSQGRFSQCGSWPRASLLLEAVKKEKGICCTSHGCRVVTLQGNESGFPTKRGFAGKNHRLKHALPGWEYVSFEEGKWMIGTLEPSSFGKPSH